MKLRDLCENLHSHLHESGDLEVRLGSFEGPEPTSLLLAGASRHSINEKTGELGRGRMSKLMLVIAASNLSEADQNAAYRRGPIPGAYTRLGCMVDLGPDMEAALLKAAEGRSESVPDLLRELAEDYLRKKA